MLDLPRRFKMFASSPILTKLGLGDQHGVYFPDIGEFLIMSEERGADMFQGSPEDEWVEWIDK